MLAISCMNDGKEPASSGHTVTENLKRHDKHEINNAKVYGYSTATHDKDNRKHMPIVLATPTSLNQHIIGGTFCRRNDFHIAIPTAIKSSANHMQGSTHA